MYRLRIDDRVTFDLNDLIKLSESKSYVIVRHELPHGNPHYHLFVHNDLKENTYRQRIKRRFESFSSSDYSLKTCNPDRINEYVQYLFNTKHGNRWELIDTHNFDLELLDSLKEAAQKITDEFVETRKQSKSKGPTIWDLAQELEKAMAEVPLDKVLGKNPDRYDEYRMIWYTDNAIEILRKHRKAFDEFLLRKIITTAISFSQKGKEILRYKMLRSFNVI